MVATSSYSIQRVWRSAILGVIAAQIGGFVFISCYAQPRRPEDEYENFLAAVQLEASFHSHVVIASDFNAWHTEWGSARNNQRGENLLQLIQGVQLQVINTGNELTFIGRGAATSSVINVCFATPSIARAETWEVHEFARSDHQLITYIVGEAEQQSHGS